MKMPAKKQFFIASLVLSFASLVPSQDAKTTQQNSAPVSASPTNTVSTNLTAEKTAPFENAVLFVSPKPGGDTVGFFTAPDGSAAFIPVSETQKAFQSGYRPVIFGDIVQAVSTYTTTIQEQQKKIDDLTAQYNALVVRLNQGSPSRQVDSSISAQQQAADEKRAMRLMLFQSLLSRTAPATPPTRIEVTDCNAHPALCVH